MASVVINDQRRVPRGLVVTSYGDVSLKGRVAQKQPWILLTHRTNNLGRPDGDPKLGEGTRLLCHSTHTPSRSRTGERSTKYAPIAQAKSTLSLTSTAGNLPVELHCITSGKMCDQSRASEEEVKVLAPCGRVDLHRRVWRASWDGKE